MWCVLKKSVEKNVYPKKKLNSDDSSIINGENTEEIFGVLKIISVKFSPEKSKPPLLLLLKFNKFMMIFIELRKEENKLKFIK